MITLAPGPRFLVVRVKRRKRPAEWRFTGTTLAPRPITDKVDVPRWPHLPAPPDELVAGCLGRADLMEDTTPAGIIRAQRVCAVCPVQDWCRTQARHAADEGLPIMGVWAGVAYANGSALAGVA